MFISVYDILLYICTDVRKGMGSLGFRAGEKRAAFPLHGLEKGGSEKPLGGFPQKYFFEFF